MKKILNRLRISKPANLMQSVIETIILNIIVYGLMIIFFPNDPLMYKIDFPWFIFAPLFLSLMYGFIVSMINIVFLLSAAVVVVALGLVESNNLPMYFIAGIGILFFLGGEFNVLWANRFSKLKQENKYIKQRLNEFTNSYYQLKLSHDELERRFLTSSYSIWGNMTSLKNNIFNTTNEQITEEKAMSLIMKFFVNQFDIYRAGIYPINSNNKPAEKPIATHGRNFTLSGNDKLINICINQKQVISVKIDIDDEDMIDSPFKLIVPFIDSQNKIWAILAVEEIPFYFYNDEIFKMMAVTGSYVADLIAMKNELNNNIDPKQAEFAVNLKRAIINSTKYKITSSLLLLNVKKDGTEKIINKTLKSILRGLDILRCKTKDDTQQFIILLPLENKTGLDTFIDNFIKTLKEKTGKNMEALNVKIAAHEIIDNNSLQEFALKQLGEELQIIK